MIRVSALLAAMTLLSLHRVDAQIPLSNPTNVATLAEDSQEIQRQALFRHATFQQAWTAVQQNGRPLFLYVTSDNCVYCKKMLRDTLSHRQIGATVAKYTEPFAFNASKAPELSEKLGVRGYPTTLVISSDRELLCRIEGFVEPEEFAERVWPVLQKAEVARRVAFHASVSAQ